jgi:hypothetical protein
MLEQVSFLPDFQKVYGARPCSTLLLCASESGQLFYAERLEDL